MEGKGRSLKAATATSSRYGKISYVTGLERIARSSSRAYSNIWATALTKPNEVLFSLESNTDISAAEGVEEQRPNQELVERVATTRGKPTLTTETLAVMGHAGGPDRKTNARKEHHSATQKFGSLVHSVHG